MVLIDDAQLFAEEDGLCSALCIQFYKEVSAVGLYRLKRNEEAVGYFLVTETIGHQVEHFMFALADAEAIEFDLVEGKSVGCGIVHVLNDDFFARKAQARPNAKCGEEKRDCSDVKLEREVADKEAVLDQTEDEDDYRKGDAVEEDGLFHCAGQRKRKFCFRPPMTTIDSVSHPQPFKPNSFRYSTGPSSCSIAMALITATNST